MRKIFTPTGFVLLLTFLFSSCSKTSTDSIPTSLKLYVDKSSVTADGVDKITVSVKDQDGNDVSTTSSVYTLASSATAANYVGVGNVGISFEINQQGTYKVFAKKYSVTSDTLIISTINPGPAKYTPKVIAEAYTGAWAGWCPRMDYKTDNYMLNNANIFTIRYHNNDALTDRVVDSTLRGRYYITSVPTVHINRNVIFKENGDVLSFADSTGFRDYLQKRPVLGLAINSSISGNTLNITPKVGFDATMTDSLKLIVAVVEDGLTLSQYNYYSNNTDYPGTPFFNSGNPITNYTHNKVYRATPTTILGETITASAQTKNGEFSKSYTVNIAGYNSSKLTIVAFVVYADGQTKNGVINAQWVKAGQNKNYD